MQNYKQEQMQIYIATHKYVKDLPTEEIYVPIHVGAQKIHDNWGYLRDDINDNISQKNSNYCELTGLYWVWKNRQSDIVGLVHYRRYFFDRAMQHSVNNVLEEDKIIKILENKKIILPKPYYLSKNTVQEDYYSIHQTRDLEICGEIIAEKYPEYIDAFHDTMKSRHFYTYNMFITSWELFDDYMSWLFDVLGILEERIDITQYSDYNKRVYGFLAERLFNVWLEKNNHISREETNVNNIEGRIIFPILKNQLKKWKIGIINR